MRASAARSPRVPHQAWRGRHHSSRTRGIGTRSIAVEGVWPAGDEAIVRPTSGICTNERGVAVSAASPKGAKAPDCGLLRGRRRAAHDAAGDECVKTGRAVTDEPPRARPTTLFERRVAIAALAAAPALVAVGAVSAAIWPEVMAEGDTATGSDLVVGALAGLAMFVVVAAVPQLLFGLALRSGRRRPLTITAFAAPFWALYVGFLPLIAALVEGWDGLAPPAVIAAAAAGVLDGFVMAAALSALRRLGGSESPVTQGGPRRGRHRRARIRRAMCRIDTTRERQER